MPCPCSPVARGARCVPLVRGSIRAAARVRRVRLRKSNYVKIIPTHMMIREIIPGRQQRVRRCYKKASAYRSRVGWTPVRKTHTYIHTYMSYTCKENTVRYMRTFKFGGAVLVVVVLLISVSQALSR